MQFKVPQNVQREDKIVGPLTLKQLIICGAGGGVAYFIYVTLAREFIAITWIPPVAIVVILTIAFAFIRPLDLSFTKWVLLWIEQTLIPRQRMWVQSSGDPMPMSMTTTAAKSAAAKKKEEEPKKEEAMDKQKKLEELTKQLEEQDPNLK